jgi:hypothetical protein
MKIYATFVKAGRRNQNVILKFYVNGMIMVDFVKKIIIFMKKLVKNGLMPFGSHINILSIVTKSTYFYTRLRKLPFGQFSPSSPTHRHSFYFFMLKTTIEILSIL